MPARLQRRAGLLHRGVLQRLTLQHKQEHEAECVATSSAGYLPAPGARECDEAANVDSLRIRVHPDGRCSCIKPPTCDFQLTRNSAVSAPWTTSVSSTRRAQGNLSVARPSCRTNLSETTITPSAARNPTQRSPFRWVGLDSEPPPGGKGLPSGIVTAHSAAP